jgi:hypothetical protein
MKTMNHYREGVSPLPHLASNNRFKSRKSVAVALSTMFAATMMFATNTSEVHAGAAACSKGGSCKVGDVGPAGGIVFYDAGSLQWWGRYLEVPRGIPVGTNLNGLVWSPEPARSVYEDTTTISARRQRVRSRLLGMGRENTERIVAVHGDGEYAAAAVARLRINGFDDWFLPSKDELDAYYNFRRLYRRTAPYEAAPHWTSTESSPSYAFYQLFQDGTQYTDENGLVKGITGNKQFNRSNMHAGSGFRAQRMRVLPMRAFPKGSGVIPPFEPRSSSDMTCAQGGACVVGDMGPGGGIVFYDASEKKSWGRYLEAAPIEAEGQRLPWRPRGNKAMIYNNISGGLTAAEQRVAGKAIGMGAANTSRIVQKVGRRSEYAARYADELVFGGKDDWFLPSKDELDLMFKNLHTAESPRGGFTNGFYWSSSDYNNSTAWLETFTTGQQWDMEQWKFQMLTMAAKPYFIRPIRAFG